MTALELGHVFVLLGTLLTAMFMARGFSIRWIAGGRPQSASPSPARLLIDLGIAGASCYVGRQYAQTAYFVAIVAAGAGIALCLIAR